MPVTYEEGAFLFLRNSPADFFFYLRSGFVKLYWPREERRRTLVALARPGDVLGSVGSPNFSGVRGQIFDAQALTRCSVGLFSRSHLTHLLGGSDPAALVRILEHFNSNWLAMLEWYVTFIALAYRERLLLLLNDLATHCGVREQRGVLLLPRLTHEDFAEMIGSSRAMVSRLLGDFSRQDLIARIDTHHLLLKEKGLKARSLTLRAQLKNVGPFSLGNFSGLPGGETIMPTGRALRGRRRARGAAQPQLNGTSGTREPVRQVRSHQFEDGPALTTNPQDVKDDASE